MVQIIRKGQLPDASELNKGLRPAAVQSHRVVLREPRPAGFHLLFTAALQIIEPAVAFLHEHLVQREHTADTLEPQWHQLKEAWIEHRCTVHLQHLGGKRTAITAIPH